MRQKRQEYNNKTGERLSRWLDELNATNPDIDKRRKQFTQTTIASTLGMKQQTISKICKGEQTLTPELARLISQKFPKRFIDKESGLNLTQHINPEYLLGMDDVPKYVEGIVNVISLDCLDTVSEKYIPLNDLASALGKVAELIMYHGYRITFFTKTESDDSGDINIPMVKLTASDGNKINLTSEEYSDLCMNIYNSVKKELLFLFSQKKTEA